MPKSPEPWYWTKRKAWYAQISGKRVLLVRGPEDDPSVRAQAHQRFADHVKRLQRIGALPLNPGEVYSVKTLGNLFLTAKRSSAANTVKNYKMVVDSFVRDYGDMAAEEITLAHVRAWTDANKWSDGTIHSHLTILKTWWAWAAEEEHIPVNTLRKLKRPPASVRQRIPSSAEAMAFLRCEKPRELQDVLVALYATGCRPCEVYAVTAADISFEPRCWKLHSKTTRATGRIRVVYFPPWLTPLLKKLIEQSPEGPIFRSPNGRPWNGTMVSKCVARIRGPHKIPDHVTPGTLRHVFATEALGDHQQSAEVVAKLLGHTNTSQVFSTYGRLGERPDRLQSAVSEIRPQPDVPLMPPPLPVDPVSDSEA